VELAMKEQTQLSIDQEGRPIAASRGESLHQCALGILPQRVHGHTPAEVSLGRCRVAAGQRVSGQLLQRGQVGLFAHQPFRNQPLLVATFDQGPPVERGSLLQRREISAVDRLVESQDVCLGLGQSKRERVGGRREKASSFLAQCLAQIGECAAQAVCALPVVALRPEGAGQPGALDRLVPPEGEKSQEPLPSAGAQRTEGLALQAHLQRTKEADEQRAGVQRGRHRASAPLPQDPSL